MVPVVGFEPTSLGLQPRAITRFAKRGWWTQLELNQRLIVFQIILFDIIAVILSIVRLCAHKLALSTGSSILVRVLIPQSSNTSPSFPITVSTNASY